jgi:DNA-binding NarL/FixJ family response regulator
MEGALAPRLKLLVAEDHALVRNGVVTILNLHDGLEVIAEAGDGEEAVRLCLLHRPDVALVDLQMPKLTGAEVIRRVRASAPRQRFIVLTSHGGDGDIRRALDAGASAYLLKDCSPEELTSAVRRVHAGGTLLSSQVKSNLINAPMPEALTPRELEVLRLLCSGRSNLEIGSEMGISELTVKTHVKRILGKLAVKDRTQAVLMALRRGLTHLEETEEP